MAAKKHKVYGSQVENMVFTIVNTSILIIFSVIMLYPILNTLAISFNNGIDTVRGGIYLWPRQFTLKNYQTILVSNTIGIAFLNSVTKTIISVVTNVFFTTMLAYTLSRREYVLGKFISVMFVLTMYFSAGLIPTYMLMKGLHLVNSYNVYWVPGILSAFNIMVVRTFIRGIPDSLVESAKADGAGEFRIFWQIIFPLCLPALATIALFVAVGSWNSWFDTFIYNSTNPKLSTLQYELQKLLSSAMNQNSNQTIASVSSEQIASLQVTPTSIRAAITIFTAVPILIVYPFMQRYFVTGLTLGGVKG
ncbi:MAG: carbohydrate ABC transporter permease [Treponema sp.]|jgi:putative aldouronate transport system permease protein|nr:carbohydrate ABC transporter permease [Treponema sp.]